MFFFFYKKRIQDEAEIVFCFVFPISVGVSAITVILEVETIAGARFPGDFKMNAGIVMSRRRVVHYRVVYHLNVTIHKSFHWGITMIAIMRVLCRFLLPFSVVTATAAAALKSPSFLPSAV